MKNLKKLLPPSLCNAPHYIDIGSSDGSHWKK